MKVVEVRRVSDRVVAAVLVFKDDVLWLFVDILNKLVDVFEIKIYDQLNNEMDMQ